MPSYFVHNGYSGWSYGTPSDPQLICASDAAKLMKVAGLTAEQVSLIVPPAQYAESGDTLFAATNCNRYLFFGDLRDCVDVDYSNVDKPMHIAWARG
ncbi:hypothetical protein [Stenotrophomonas sp. PS02289]|uniref:hypothetical protein n=1 Tax=Stenotrophomonas sp. PS02289 TaxID=2991422 RepID=UPI00249A1572|nr:hypothetical protein [Stenotrophomonas sp. PS02289]